MRRTIKKALASFTALAAAVMAGTVAVFAQAEPTFGEKMAQAGRNTVIGLVTVFIILLVLSFLISLFRFIAPKKKTASKPVKTEFVNTTKPAAAEDDTELVAVIMAAIAASEGESFDPTKYRLKSIKRVSTTRRWNRARREA